MDIYVARVFDVNGKFIGTKLVEVAVPELHEYIGLTEQLQADLWDMRFIDDSRFDTRTLPEYNKLDKRPSIC